ncbi:MAG TPA: DUF4190 domain-containing protein [Thermoanaerobaculia bacterium]|nr:DUF4190 domain-containing protein [Thermoanaerobaculia bacterium]
MATAAPDKASSQAVTSLILGILGILCCPICGPIAWYLGNQELRAVREGRSSPASQGMAQAGQILGIVGTVLFVFTLLWVFAFGGMAIVGGILESMN